MLLLCEYPWHPVPLCPMASLQSPSMRQFSRSEVRQMLHPSLVEPESTTTTVTSSTSNNSSSEEQQHLPKLRYQRMAPENEDRDVVALRNHVLNTRKVEWKKFVEATRTKYFPAIVKVHPTKLTHDTFVSGNLKSSSKWHTIMRNTSNPLADKFCRFVTRTPGQLPPNSTCPNFRPK